MSTVLVIDDEEPIRRNIGAYLEDIGHRVRLAVNGREGLEIFAREQPDVVLTDLRMPDLDGLAVVVALRRLSPDTPLIVMSGAGDARDAVAAINEGAWDYLVKPIEFDRQIDVAIARVLERQRLVMENRRHQSELEALVAIRTSELADRERTLRIVADNTYDWEWWRAPDGRFVYCSPSCERITGHAREAFMDDPGLLARIVHPEDRAVFEGHVSDRTGEPTEGLHFRVQHADGTMHWIEHNCRPLYADDGTFLGRRGSNRDATDRKKLQAQLLRLQREESLGRMTSGIAHDLNNVLTPITMAAESLQDADLTASQREQLEAIRESAGRGADLVHRLVSYTRGLERPRASVNVSDVVSDVARMARNTFPACIRVHWSAPPWTWHVHGDATQLHQVVLNLCINARDAMLEGGTLGLHVEYVELDEDTARSNPRARAGRFAVLTVTDTGVGIPADAVDRIFDPFFTTKAIGDGTGLGLSIVHGIVQSHGGFIEVDSRPGQGSRFSVYLPVIADPAQAGAPPPPAAPALTAVPAGAGRCVLVVDDEDLVRDMMRRILRLHGYQVLVAEGGEQALDLYRQHRGTISVVLLDSWMPHMDGLATIRELERIDPAARVIVVSGLAEDRDRLVQASAIVKGFLDKPWRRIGLLAAVHAVATAADAATS